MELFLIELQHNKTFQPDTACFTHIGMSLRSILRQYGKTQSASEGGVMLEEVWKWESMQRQDNNTYSLINGIWFLFEDGENSISVGGSVISGYEKIYVNDDLVSEKRSYSKSSKHSFQYGNENYDVEYLVPSLVKGKLLCRLSKNNKVIKIIKTEFRKIFNLSLPIAIALVGILCSFAMGFFGLPTWVILPLLIVCFYLIIKSIVFLEEAA